MFGCTNPAATNYDVTATLDDLSCVLPCTVSLSLDNVTPLPATGNDALIQVLASGAQGSDDYYLDAIEGNVNLETSVRLFRMYTVYVVDAECTDSLDVDSTEVVEVNAG